MHLRREVVREALALAARDLRAISRGGEVAHHDRRAGSTGNTFRRREGAADDRELDGLSLEVLDSDESLSRTPVDELDAEDLALRERGADSDLQSWGLGRLIEDSFGIDLVETRQWGLTVVRRGRLMLTWANAGQMEANKSARALNRRETMLAMRDEVNCARLEVWGVEFGDGELQAGVSEAPN